MSLDDETLAKLEAFEGGDGTADLVGLFEGLPVETEREWELILTRLIEKAPDRHRDLGRLIGLDGIETVVDEDVVKFAAFFAYCTYHRRQENISEFGRLLRVHDEFEPHPMFPLLEALHSMSQDTVNSFDEAISHAREAVNRVGTRHAGVTHCLASAIIAKLENQDRQNISSSEFDVLIAEAEDNIESATDESDYPKFRVTEGRLLALKGEYDKAIQRIHEAIDKEDASKQDYPLRVGGYRLQESKFVLQKHAAQLQSEQEELHNEQSRIDDNVQRAIEKVERVSEKSEVRLKDLQSQTVQFLGFFATLLAVIISSISIATSIAPLNAASQIVVMTGGMMAAFGGFSIMLPIVDARRRGATVFGAGLAILLLGFTTLIYL